MAYSPSTSTIFSTPNNMLPSNVVVSPKSTPIENQLLSPSHYQKIIAEVVGTYIFVFACCASGLIERENALTALIPPLALMAMIYAVAHISGAHFNPAVTAAFAVARRLPFTQVPMYVLSQLFGSTLASLTLRLLFRHQTDFLPMLTRYDPASTSDLEAVVWEFICTFILTFTIFGVASDRRAACTLFLRLHICNSSLCGVAIGGALLLDALIGESITGASMNPARSLGPAIAVGDYKNQWVYVVSPLLGGLAASLVYSLLRPTQLGKENDGATSVYNDLYHPQV